MKQALHIFAKDARHFWPEVLVSLVITAAFARIYPINWAPMGETEQLRVIASNAITALVPISWAILIARVVHDESLVGDRQFWVTRPYEWTSLLAAKAIFLLIFLYLPILLAHWALLYQAGFNPLAYVPGLLFNLLLITGILVLPLFAMAAVTSTFARMTLTLLGVLLAVIGLAATGLMVSHVNVPDEGSFSAVIFFSLIAAVIVLQFATRRTLSSRLVLLGVCSVGIAAGALIPSSVERAYPRPASSGHSPVQLALDPSREAYASTGFGNKRDTVLNIPLLVSGVVPGTAIKIDNLMVSIEAPNGLHWTSPWSSTYNLNYLPSTNQSTINLTISRPFYEQVKSMPLTMRITFAVTQLRAGATSTVPLVQGNTSVPGLGICQLSGSGGFLGCRFPLRQPRLSLVSSVLSEVPCVQVSSNEPAGVPGQTWIGSLDDSPADFGLTSVWDSSLSLAKAEDGFAMGDFYRNHGLCPGSPLTVTRYEIAGRTQTDLTITGLKVTERPPFGGMGAFSVGIGIK